MIKYCRLQLLSVCSTHTKMLQKKKEVGVPEQEAYFFFFVYSLCTRIGSNFSQALHKTRFEHSLSSKFFLFVSFGVKQTPSHVSVQLKHRAVLQDVHSKIKLNHVSQSNGSSSWRASLVTNAPAANSKQ